MLFNNNFTRVSAGMEGSSSGGSSGVATPSPVGMDQNEVGNFSAWSPDSPPRDHFSSTRLEAEPTPGMSASASNSNVMFARKGFGDPSPVETTTEL